MVSLTEIEHAVELLPALQQRQLLRFLADRLEEKLDVSEGLPLVAATGRPISQQEIDDAVDGD